MAVAPERLVLLASGLAMLALAAAILASSGRHRPHRFLGALLAMRGMTVLLPQLGSDPRWTVAAVNLQPYFALAVVPLAVACLAASMQGQPRRAGLGWATVAAIAGLDLAYLVDHRAVHATAPGTATVGALQAAPGLVYTSFGPLFAVVAAAPLLLAMLGLRYAVWYRRDAGGPDARTWLLLAAGLIAGGLFDGTSRLAALASLLDHGAGYPWLPWGWAVAVLPVTALGPAGLGVAVLAANRSVDPRPHHALEGNLLALAAFAAVTGLMRMVLPPSSDAAGHPAVLVLLGLWRLVMPVLVAVALVLDVRVRHGLQAPDAAEAPAAVG